MKINHPNLDWRDTTPIAERYGDIYYSPDDALGEVRHNFISCIMPVVGACKTLVIGETGFGTGLNFLVTWHDWLQHRRTQDRLIFISTEAHPLRTEDLQRALEPFNELKPFADQLIGVWPVGIPGPHRRFFSDGMVELWVFYGDALTELRLQNFQANAWYFDGFNPSENPDLWSPELITECARLMAPGAVGGSFTVAGAVRQAFDVAGLQTEKRPGFGRKRECLKVKKPGAYDRAPIQSKSLKILGGGIAGTSLILANWHRGGRSQIIDPNGIGTGASGNPAALVNFRPTKHPDQPWSRLLASSLANVQPHYKTHWLPHRGTYKPAFDIAQADEFRACLEAMGWSPDALNWMPSPPGFIDNNDPNGQPLGGLHCPLAGHVPAKTVCENFAAAANDLDEDEDVIVFANGFAALDFAPDLSQSLRRNLGQIIWAPASLCPPAPMPTTFGTYLTPPLPDQTVVAGSTYIREPDWHAENLLAPQSKASEEIRQKIKMQSGLNFPSEISGERVGVRAFGKDHRPLVGQTYDGTWVLTGLGSRGFLTAPLLGEILLDEIEGRALADLPTYDFKHCVHPSRFPNGII